MTQAELAKVALSPATMISYLESGTKRANGVLDPANRRKRLATGICLSRSGDSTTDSSYSTELHVAQEADAIRNPRLGVSDMSWPSADSSVR